MSRDCYADNIVIRPAGTFAGLLRVGSRPLVLALLLLVGGLLLGCALGPAPGGSDRHGGGSPADNVASAPLDHDNHHGTCSLKSSTAGPAAVRIAPDSQTGLLAPPIPRANAHSPSVLDTRVASACTISSGRDLLLRLEVQRT